MRIPVPATVFTSGVVQTLLRNAGVLRNKMEANRLLTALSKGEIEDVRKARESDDGLVIEVKWKGDWYTVSFQGKS